MKTQEIHTPTGNRLKSIRVRCALHNVLVQSESFMIYLNKKCFLPNSSVLFSIARTNLEVFVGTTNSNESLILLMKLVELF